MNMNRSTVIQNTRQRWFHTRYPHLAPLWEVVLRRTLSSFCGVALAVWAPSRIIPQDDTDIVAMINLCFVPALPAYAFSIGAVGLMMEHDMLFALGCATMWLAAFTVSDGLGVAIGAVLAIVLTTFQFGPGTGMTTLFAEFGLTLGGLLAMSYRQLVQDGISVTIDGPPAEDSPFFQFVREVLSGLCDQLGQPEDCWKGTLPPTDSTIEFTIPGDGDFAGQTAIVTPNTTDSSLTIAVEGGLWIVAGLWKWKGMDNPLAGLRNFFIAWSWGMVCLLPGILCPPVRTMRKALSQGLIPAALKDVASLVRIHLDRAGKNPKDLEEEGARSISMAVGESQDDVIVARKSSTEDIVEDEIEKNEEEGSGGSVIEKSMLVKGDKTIESNDEDEEKTVGRLIHYAATLAGGKLAVTTAYEPRLRAPFECSWPILQDLMCSVHYLILTTIAVSDAWDQAKDRETISAFYLTLGKVDGILDRCISALVSNDEPADKLDSLELPSETMISKDRINDCLTGAIRWLNAMHHPDMPPPWTKAGLKNIKGTYLPLLRHPIALFKGLLNAFLLPFRPELWDIKSVVWTVKWTIGWVALTCMSVYWEDFHDFGIETGKDGSSSGLFDGWNLLAYGFTWTSTVEGTVKKGLQRCIGASFGGFAAWLGIIVCSWSYDDDAEINPYGLVAWLTAMSFLNALFSVGRVTDAFMGRSKDYGCIYFGLTLGICALEVFSGKGTKGDIVVNRLVTTLTGCGMAIFLALLPPCYWGIEPESARDLLVEEKAAVANCLCVLVSAKEKKSSELKSAQNSFHSNASKLYANATARLKDATGLKLLPFFKDDPELNKLFDELAVTASMIYSWFDRAAELTIEEDVLAEFAPGGRAHQEVKNFIKELGTAEVDDDEGHLEPSTTSPDGTVSPGKDSAPIHPQVDMFIVLTRQLIAHFKDHDSTLLRFGKGGYW